MYEKEVRDDFVKMSKMLEEKDRQLADLEAKLAESEEKCKKAYQEGLLQKQFDKDMEIEQLKQQLAEKEKELKQIKLDLGMFKSVNEFINEYGIKKAREVLLQTEKTKRQDKISFTTEQLEKVKKEFNERKLEYITMETKTHIYGLRIDRINELIDNQINELKGEKVEEKK